MNPVLNLLAGAIGLGASGLGAGQAAAADITIGMQLEPPSLDPTSGAAAAIDEVVYANVFEGLVRFAEDGSIKPALATSWEIGENGLVYNFKLREGVTFHDGSDMTAEDVKFSIDRIGAEDSTNAQKTLYAAILQTEVVDDHRFRILLNQPTGAFLSNLAWGDAVIVSPESIADDESNPVGTGPFKFSAWNRGDSVEIVKNDDYWGTPARLDKATFKFISDPNAAFAAVMAGDIDAFPGFPAPELLEQFQADPRFIVVVGSTEGETILAMNNKSGMLSDVRVRAAIAHAVDRQALIEGALFGYGEPIGTHFAPHHPAYVDLTLQSAHNPEFSRELLKAAGAGNLTLSLKLPPPSYARRGGEIIAAQLREVGIETEITNLEWAGWLDQVFKGKDYDLTIVSHTEPFDIGIYGRDDYYFNYDSEEFDTLHEMLDASVNDVERAALMKALQRKIADDYVNGFLFQLPRIVVQDERIKGLWANSPTQANDLTSVYWEE